MANNFSINVGTILDTSNVPKDLEKIQAKLTKAIDIPIRIKDVDNKTGEVVWQKAVKSLRTYKDELGNTYNTIVKLNQEGQNFIHIDGTVEQEKLRKITESAKVLTTEVHKWADSSGAIQKWTTTIDDSGRRVSTRVKEVIDDMGNITKITSKLASEGAGKPFHKLGKDIVEVSELLKETTTETKTSFGKITDTVNGVTQTFDGTITTIKKMSSNGEELTTVISKYTNDMGQAVEKTEQFNKAGVQVATTMRKIGDVPTVKSTSKETLINKDGVKTVTEYVNGIATLRTVTSQSVDSFGKLTKEVKVYDEQTHKLISTHKELINNQQQQLKLDEQQKQLKQQLVKATQQEEQIITRNGTTLKANVTTIKEQTHEYGEVTTKIIKYKDALGNLVTETTKEDAQGRALAQSTKTVEQEMNKAADATNKMGNAAQNSSGKVQTLGGSFASALSQLTRFYLASLPLRAVTKIISETTEAVKDFDAAITEMGKVTDYQGEQLRKYAEDLGNLGKEVARTRTEMVEGATGWLKAGYSEEDAAKLAKYSALLQNTADEELSAADATSILVSQLKAYHMEADEAIKITDIINKVSAEQAVSSADISKGLQQASSSMATFGNTIEQTTALLTGGTTIFQGQSQRVARALNTIAIRVTKNKDELSKYGVVVENTDGSLRSTYDILTDLKPKWDAMTDAERTALGATLAGTNQYRILAAVMSQMDVVQETYQQALDATGTTMKQNEVYMGSLEAKTTALKAEFENIVLGKGGLQDMAKFFVDLGTGALKLINSLGGLKTIFVALAGVILTVKIESLIKGFNNFISVTGNLIAKLPQLITLLRTGGTAGISMNEQLKEMGINATTTQLAIGALTAAITIGIAVWSAYQASVAKTKAELEASKQAYEQYSESLNETIEKIQNENTSKEELLKINKDLHGSYDNEKQDLVDLKGLRKENIDLLYEEAKAKSEAYLREHGSEKYEAERFFGTSLGNANNFELKKSKTFTTIASIFSAGGTADLVKTKMEEIFALKPEEAVEELNKRIDNLKDTIEELNYKEEKNGKLTSDEKILREESTVLLKNYENVLTKTNDEIERQNGNVEALNEAEKNSKKTKQEFLNINNQTIDSHRKLSESTSELINKYNLETDAILSLMEEQELGFNEAVQLLAQEKVAAYGAVEAYEELSKSTSSLVSEINDLASALNEQEKNGSIALETQLKLIDAGYAMALSYDQETGACKLDEEATKKLVEAKLEMQIANLNIAKSAVVDTLIAEGNAAVTAAGEFLALAKAKNIASQSYFNHKGGRDITDPSLSTSGYGGNAGYLKIDTSEAQKQLAAYDKQIDALENSLKQVQKGGVKAFNSVGKAAGGAGKAASGAGKAATDAGKATEKAAQDAKKAIQDEVKALEDKKSKYDRVIKWIEKQYDKQIDKIKKAKEEALEAIEAQIKAKEKQKDKELDAIEKQINALEKEKDKRKEYWDAQIDALKKANKEKKDALELQEKLDALEKAKSTKVKIYKEGQGFVYDVDQTAVQEAQKALDEYLSEKAYEEELQRLEDLRDAELKNYEERIKALDEYKDRVQESYEKQIENLKTYKEQVEANYDAQIEMYENYKQKFEDMVNAYEEEQDRLLALELAGIDAENNNWMTRLDNLQNFVSSYHDLLRQIEDAKARMDAVTSSTPSVGGGGGGGNSTTPTPSGGGTSGNVGGGNNNNNTRTVTNQDYPYNQYTPNPEHKKQTKFPTTATRGTPYHAKGIDTIPNDEIAIVGDAPNQELVIGSKLNGKLMSLNKGDGVVNAESSKTLAGMLNQIGKYGASGFGSGNGTLNNNINNDSLTINGVTIQGADIKDPQTFVNGLLNLKAEALQRAYSHK